ncbi:MAG: hypothetical protein J6S85_12820 [Methanobrevibacter sp.]|nr:hypothetical protein [Methanobrevibacter sp.]
MDKKLQKAIDKYIISSDIIKVKKKMYHSNFFTFDIEATNIKKLKQAVMYMFSVCFEGKRAYYGRTWNEFIEILDYINSKSECKVVCYIHNLSYEFQYMKGVIDFGDDNVFLMDMRKPLKIDYQKIEFRCSYMLTNMNLRLFLETMGVKNQKLEYNYKKYRFPWSPLTKQDFDYSGNDVIGLHQALTRYFEMNGDDVVSTPLTNTGFVRRDIKKVLKENVNDSLLARLQPNEELLSVLREAFRGGDTHASRFYNQTVVHDVDSIDRKSSYPASMVIKSYPMTPFQKVGHVPLETVERKIHMGFALLMRVAVYNIRLKDDLEGCPYISFSKCRNCQDYVLDNGRVIEADYLEMTITDVDYQIIKDMYEWESYQQWDTDNFIVVDCYQSRYKKLPQCVIDEIMKYFKAKETLKHVNPELYMKSKNRLNSIYGMTVLNPLKKQYKFSENEYKVKDLDIKKIIDDLIQKKFIPYQVGVWVTCWSRLALHEARKELKPLEFIYCDTDSVKYIGGHDFTEFNEKQKQIAINNDAYFIDDSGEGHYLGIWEKETENANYSEFVTLGAKKYCYRQNGELHITLAGVSKSGVKELKNNIKNFKEGFTFKKSAGLTATYNDNIHETIKYRGHKLTITDNLYLEETTYKINLQDEYKEIIGIAKKLLFCRNK